MAIIMGSGASSPEPPHVKMPRGVTFMPTSAPDNLCFFHLDIVAPSGQLIDGKYSSVKGSSNLGCEYEFMHFYGYLYFDEGVLPDGSVESAPYSLLDMSVGQIKEIQALARESCPKGYEPPFCKT